MSSLQPVKAESLSAQVADSIREAIFNGELKPGQVLRELGLAKNMNVSQATVREALSHLEHYGLVVRTPNRSTSVTNLTIEEARHRAGVWLTLENQALEKLGGETGEHLFELSAIVSAMGNGELAKEARRFHTRIWLNTGNPVLVRVLDQLTTPLFAFCQVGPGGAGEFVEYHRRILDGIREGSAPAAQAALRDLIGGVERACVPSAMEPETDFQEASASV